MGAEGVGRVRKSSAAVHGGLIDEGSHVSLEEGVNEDVEEKETRRRRDGLVDSGWEFSRLLDADAVAAVGLGERDAVGTVDLAAGRALETEDDAACVEINQ